MIIWISSYPKSGNTWIRTILASLLYSDDGNFDFKNLEKIKQFPMKRHFEGLTNDITNIDEISKNWIYAQEKLNLNNEITFLKTHHAFCGYKNYIFTNKQNTLATIYVVRDPRNVITSLSNHYLRNIQEAKKMLFNSQGVLGNKNTLVEKGRIFTILGNWADHYNSWKKLDKENTLTLKYEDLIKDPKIKILEIIDFLKKYVAINPTTEKLNNVLTSTSFENLKSHETKHGFAESIFDEQKNKKVNFFNLGKKNDFNKLLDNKIKKEIENKFYKELIELDYLKI